MRTLLVAVVAFALVTAYGVTGRAQGAAGQTAGSAPVGNAEAGKAHYAFGNTSCSNCHGVEGQGSFGPALAGRNFTYARFRAYVRNPLGRMPAYVESQLTDQEIADIVAYFNSLSPAPKPVPWRTPLPAGAPRGQQLAVTVIGCAQCHGATFETPRHGAAEVSGDFEWFKHMVYDHTSGQSEQWAQLDRSLQPVTPYGAGPPGRNRVRMGNYSRQRLPEPMLREIWDWMNDLGVHLAVLRGRVTAAEGGGGASYNVEVVNTAVKGKGITNEDVTVALALPAGTKVVSTTGGGYEGVKHDDEAKSDVAVWRIPRMAPGDRQSFTITLAAPASALRGTIRWAKPAVKADDEVTFALATGRGGRGAGAL
jgi:mono/diheme cytochrome c family protein